jgi:hypothetical protein
MEAHMQQQRRAAFAGTVFAIMALVAVVGAQPRTPGEPQRSPGEVVPFQEERKGPPRSDGYRIVGKVIAIDRAKGAIELDSDEGRRTVKAPAPLLAAARVGDMVSVERPADDGGYASPRGEDRGGRRKR